jgi:hypothetical protein
MELKIRYVNTILKYHSLLGVIVFKKYFIISLFCR